MRRIILISIIALIVAENGVCSVKIFKGVFPLWRSIAEGKELPSPFGFGLNYYYQNQNFHFVKSEIFIPDFSVTGTIPSNVNVKNRVIENNFKADLWILPFMNIFGIVGSINGKTQVDYELMSSKIIIDYDGIVYGSGITIAGGFKRYFGSFTATFSNTKLNESQSMAKAWILTPKVGFSMTGSRMINVLNFWIGAMYQKAEENHKGTITVEEETMGQINVEYDITLGQKRDWNVLAGMAVVFNNNFSLELEGGQGDRKHAMASIIYRM